VFFTKLRKKSEASFFKFGCELGKYKYVVNSEDILLEQLFPRVTRGRRKKDLGNSDD